MIKEEIKIKVNGRWYQFKIGKDIEPSDSLSSVLREKLGLTGVRVSCEQGACGACTVLLNNESVLSCMMLALDADGAEIVTIEGLDGSDPVVQSFVETCEPGYGTTMQCGFCTPGFIMETHALLKKKPNPTTEEIKEGLAGHICRCGCYHGITHAVEKLGGCDCKEKEEIQIWVEKRFLSFLAIRKSISVHTGLKLTRKRKPWAKLPFSMTLP